MGVTIFNIVLYYLRYISTHNILNFVRRKHRKEPRFFYNLHSMFNDARAVLVAIKRKAWSFVDTHTETLFSF